MRILVIEDEPSIAHFLDQGLRESGWSIDIASDGQAGLDCALTVPYDLVILDLMLPKLNGLTLVRELRSRGNHVPVLILSARDTVEDRVRGLDAGADDYLVKPFSFSELLARIRALMRRPATSAEISITIGDLELDAKSRTVRRGTDHIELSSREFSILEYFMRNAGQVVSRTQIAEHIWNFDSYVGSNVVDVYIGYLRKKIDVDPENSHIKTVRGVGYRFVTGE